MGWDVNEYISQIIADATSNGAAVPWAVSVGWQMERSMYEIRLPPTGSWAQIDHAASLAALETLAPKVPGFLSSTKMGRQASGRASSYAELRTVRGYLTTSVAETSA
jgi:hypothetical protein